MTVSQVSHAPAFSPGQRAHNCGMGTGSAGNRRNRPDELVDIAHGQPGDVDPARTGPIFETHPKIILGHLPSAGECESKRHRAQV